MIGIKKCLAMALNSVERSLFTDIPHFRLPPTMPGAVPSTLPGIYRPRSFVHVKRIINTYNGFLTPLLHPMPLFCHTTRSPRGICTTFFLWLHFSLSALCLYSVLNAFFPKEYIIFI